MKLVHMSDIHLTAPGKTIGGRDPRLNFERALTDILKCHHDAELLVITGDLSDWGDRDDYEWLKARLAAFPVPVRLCIGNHDRRANFLSVFPDYAGPGGFAHGVHDTAAGRCLFLDTVRTRNPCRPFLRRASAMAGGAAVRTSRTVPAVHAPQSDADPSRTDGPDKAAR